jgi:hypothetical protein
MQAPLDRILALPALTLAGLLVKMRALAFFSGPEWSAALASATDEGDMDLHHRLFRQAYNDLQRAAGKAVVS